MIEHLKWLGRRMSRRSPRIMQPAITAWSSYRVRQMIGNGEFDPTPGRVSASDGYATPEAGEGIPRVIHQIWTHPPLPANLHKFHNSVLDHHPASDWEHRLWDLQEMDALVAERFPQFEAAYHSLPMLVNKIDVIRLMIVAIHGGVYLDLDYLCTAPFGDLLEDCQLCLTRANDRPEAQNYLSNFFFAAAPGHPLLFDCVAAILDRPEAEIRAFRDPIHDTGPHLLTSVWRSKEQEYAAKILQRVVLSVPAEYYTCKLTPPPLCRGFHVCTGTWR